MTTVNQHISDKSGTLTLEEYAMGLAENFKMTLSTIPCETNEYLFEIYEILDVPLSDLQLCSLELDISDIEKLQTLCETFLKVANAKIICK